MLWQLVVGAFCSRTTRRRPARAVELLGTRPSPVNPRQHRPEPQIGHTGKSVCTYHIAAMYTLHIHLQPLPIGPFSDARTHVGRQLVYVLTCHTRSSSPPPFALSDWAFEHDIVACRSGASMATLLSPNLAAPPPPPTLHPIRNSTNNTHTHILYHVLTCLLTYIRTCVYTQHTPCLIACLSVCPGSSMCANKIAASRRHVLTDSSATQPILPFDTQPFHLLPAFGPSLDKPLLALLA